jgi:hypothetical protein
MVANPGVAKAHHPREPLKRRKWVTLIPFEAHQHDDYHRLGGRLRLRQSAVAVEEGMGDWSPAFPRNPFCPAVSHELSNDPLARGRVLWFLHTNLLSSIIVGGAFLLVNCFDIVLFVISL